MKHVRIHGANTVALPIARALLARGIRVTLEGVEPSDIPGELANCLSDGRASPNETADMTLDAHDAPFEGAGPVASLRWPAAGDHYPCRFATPFGRRALVEMTPTAPPVLHAFAAALGMDIATVPDGKRAPGAVLSAAILQCLDDALLQGATVLEIDDALIAAGADIGFFEAMDIAGLAPIVSEAGDQQLTVTRQMLREGRLGRVTGVGWYRYPGRKGPIEDPITEDLARTEAWLAGRVQDPGTPQDVVRALRQTVQSETTALLRGGVTPGALAKILRLGLGLPASWIVM